MPTRKLSSVKPVAFTVVDSSDNRLDASALTFTVRIVKPSGSVAGAGTGGIGGKGITQPDVTNAQGSCYYTPGATDLNTLVDTIIRISAPGMVTREILVEVVAYDRDDGVRLGLSAIRPDSALIATVTAGTLTPTSFPVAFTIGGVAVTIPNGQLAGEAHFRWLGNVTAALAGQVQKITGYASGVPSFSTAFSTAPAIGDIGVIVNG